MLNKTGFYNVIDYSLSHSKLLIRTDEFIDGINYNTDIIFDLAFYIELPLYFKNLEIRNGNEEECNYVLSRCDPEFIGSLNSNEVFVFLTGGRKYFIGTRRITISINNLNPLLSSF